MKKILYVHGFASSGNSSTVKSLRKLFPECVVIAPDLPVHPREAMGLLREICEQEQPDLIVGTSMGGMYTEQLRGYDRIVVNPALKMDETISKNHMLGRTEFLNKRADGVQEFMMDEALQKEYGEVSRQRFQGITPEDRERVWGLFGLEDTVVTDTREMFSAHYPNVITFHGGHRLNTDIFRQILLPLIEKIL